ncbi:MAG: hypothetical protein K8S87_05890, partial [Planctomycetes bacterium]|nr:hypothetical protein [Planctomycetota bacterium]
AKFILANPGDAVFMTTRKLAKQINASEATVVRFVRKIGYKSYIPSFDLLKMYLLSGVTTISSTDFVCSAIVRIS